MSTSTLTWAEVCAIPWLKDIPAKIETNKDNKIIMSPASNWHSGYQYDIGKRLDQLLPGGRVMVECPIETSDGTRVADAAWMSKARHRPIGGPSACPSPRKSASKCSPHPITARRCWARCSFITPQAPARSGCVTSMATWSFSSKSSSPRCHAPSCVQISRCALMRRKIEGGRFIATRL